MCYNLESINKEYKAHVFDENFALSKSLFFKKSFNSFK